MDVYNQQKARAIREARRARIESVIISSSGPGRGKTFGHGDSERRTRDMRRQPPFVVRPGIHSFRNNPRRLKLPR